ncbi:hypothetical protein C2E23DRAFT_885708 [Lenzites betulinus]|nr:hypothetical protein C2E23DRAFT_885708 [Lenzites betulinus]
MNAKLAAPPSILKDAQVNAQPARPSLHVRCPSTPAGTAAVTELAMTIAEEIARLCRSPQPLGIDVPLLHSGLDPKSLSKLQSWLKSAHDYDVSLGQLLKNDTTALMLAAEIEASPRTRQRSRALPKPPKQAGSGSFSMNRRARKAPRVPICVDVTTEAEEVPVPSAAIKQYQIANDIGMAPYDSWANKKTGLMYGLLALGLVGSPMSPSFRGIKSPGVPLAAAPRLRPIPAHEDPRAVMPTRTPLFASFLDSVHMPGVEPIQSPWVADRQFASLDSMFAGMSFPRTPESA